MIRTDSIACATDPALWGDLLARDGMQDPLGTPLDQVYSRAYAATWAYDDLSMVVHDDGAPIAGLQVTSARAPDGRRAFDFYGRAMFLRRAAGGNAQTLAKAERSLAEAFLALRARHGIKDFTFIDPCPAGAMSDFSVTLLKEGLRGSPVYRQVIDLTQAEDAMRRDIRKSYKSLISWGEKNMDIVIHDRSNITPAAMEEFRQLHIAVAGRETRSAESWDVQLRQVMAGEGFVVTGRLERQLVTAALFLHSPRYALYGVSASIREMFDKPLSHAIIWTGIMQARRIGCRAFEMGELVQLYPGAGYSEKEKNIATFKRGFGGETRVMIRIGAGDEGTV